MSDRPLFCEINSRFLSIFTNHPDARELVFYGGSGSGKSTSVAQILLTRFLDTKQPPVRMLFSRKWLSALKTTLLVDCIRILQAWGAYDRIEHNKNESYMRFGQSRIDFLGLDNPEKIKGAEYNYIWLERGDDFDSRRRRLRLRLGRNKANETRIYLHLQPIDATYGRGPTSCRSRSPAASSDSRPQGQHPQPLTRWIADLLASPSRTRTIIESTRSANPASCRTLFIRSIGSATDPARRRRHRLSTATRRRHRITNSRTACRSEILTSLA